MLKIIGISGKRESGKSTLANYLVTHGYKKVSLADPLKEMCQQLYGLTKDQLYGVFKESPTQYKRTDGSFFSPRDILIREGCLKRSIDPNFWTKKLYQKIQELNCREQINKFVIDDVRFKTELDFLKSLFIKVKFVRIERSEEAVGKAALDDYSEKDLDSFKEWDYILIKELNKTPSDLEKLAQYIEDTFL